MSNENVGDSVEVIGGDPFDDLVLEGDFENEIGSEVNEESESVFDDEIDAVIAEDPSEDSELAGEEDKSEDSEAKEEESKESDKSDKQDDKTDAVEEKVEKEEEKEVINIDVKIDGEVKQFSQEEVIEKGKQAISGEIAIAKRFTELDRERQQYKSEVATVRDQIAALGEKFKANDAIGGMQLLAKHTGIAPYMVKEMLLQQALPELLKRQDMQPHEVQQEILNAQSEYQKVEKESSDKLLEEKQVITDLQNQVFSTREAHNIEVDVWNDHLKHLQETVEDEATINPDMIKESVLEFRRFERSESVLKEFDLHESENSIEDLNDIQLKYPEFSDNQLKEVVQISLDTKKKQETEAKLAKKVDKQKATKKVVKTKQIEEVEQTSELEDFFF